MCVGSAVDTHIVSLHTVCKNDVYPAQSAGADLRVETRTAMTSPSVRRRSPGRTCTATSKRFPMTRTSHRDRTQMKVSIGIAHLESANKHNDSKDTTIYYTTTTATRIVLRRGGSMVAHIADRGWWTTTYAHGIA